MDLSSISNKYSLSFGNKTDVGRIREGNEDYLASFQSKIGHIFIICDGMGGHTSGEIASRLAVTRLKEYLQTNSESSRSTKQLLLEALEDANQAIIDKTIETPEYKGMGTTCVILAIKSGVVYYSNIGDSRVYICRNGIIYQLTKDQTFVQTLVDQGYISYGDAENHPRKNELIQALGINEKIVPEVNDVALRIFKGDKFILCSDGLSGMINDNMINDIVNNNDPVTASDMLVRAANEHGGTDNITVQVISIVEGDELPEDMKNVPPIGALNKNVVNKYIIQKNGNTTRQISDYPINQQTDKRKNKTGILLVSIFSLVIIIIFYFLFFNRNGTEKTIVTKSSSDTLENHNTNNKSYSKTDSLLEAFLKKVYVYKGKDYEYPTLEDFKNIKMGTISYIDMKGDKTSINYEQLLDIIKKHEFNFIKFIPSNSFTLKDKSGKERSYSVDYSVNNTKIHISEIRYVEILEKIDKLDKDKQAFQKNTGKQNTGKVEQNIEQDEGEQKVEEKKVESNNSPKEKDKSSDLEK